MSVYVKRNPPLSLANVLYFEKKKLRKTLNTLSGNGHNIYAALKHYVYIY